MKKFLKVLGILAFLAVVFTATIIALTPWMDRWGATDAEVNATFPGDELVSAPASFVNRAVTIEASPEEIYPWLIQMGAGKGGLYSYTAFENMIGCKLVNADRIHDEWQTLSKSAIRWRCVRMARRPPTSWRRSSRTKPS